NHVSINSGTFINAHNYVEIGNGCLIGKNILISDTKHNFQDPTKWVKSNEITLEGAVIIGEGCHLGFNTLIFPGVTIGKHVQISMNSVVTHDLPPYCVAGGSPARVLRAYDFEQEKWVYAG
ncbi:MAG: acyltransferase, partial [Desulfomonilia bacterium]|nr:acyltransferase [Desulfomonilia bacterium]